MAVQSPGQPAPVLLASPYSDDHFASPEMLAESHWKWHQAVSCREALRILKQASIAVVIWKRDQSDLCWRDLLDAGVKLTAPSSLMVSSRHTDEQLWGEVLNLGGYDVLARPFAREDVGVGFLAGQSQDRQSAPAAGPTTAKAPIALAASGTNVA